MIPLTRKSYAGCHLHVRRIRGEPGKCEHCGTEDPTRCFHWANLTGNYANPFDFVRLCARCHHKMDKGKKPLQFESERLSLDLPPSVSTDLSLLALAKGTSKRRIIIDLINQKAKECRREIVAFIDKAGGMASDSGA